MLGTASHLYLGKWWLRAGRWLVLVVALLAACGAYLYLGRQLIEQTNFTDDDIRSSDQRHNLRIAVQTSADLSPDFTKGVSVPLQQWFPHRFDGVVSPLWPWVAAWLVDEDHPVPGEDGAVSAQDRELFNRGRWFHLGWTCCALVLLGVACARVLSIAGSINVVLLVGFGALLPRAAYFQPEPLFFVLFFLTWLLCLFALHRNSLWLHGLVGVVAGLAFMAKASVLPLLALFIALSMARWAWGWVLAQWPRREAAVVTTMWQRRNHWLGVFMTLFCFAMTAGPLLTESARVFGSPLHSYPGYWMWFDDFNDCFKWMNDHGTKAKLQALPKAERPSFSKYKAEHTPEQMWARLRDGTEAKVLELIAPPVTKQSQKNPKPWKGVLELRGWYLGALAGIFALVAGALLICTKRATNASQSLHPEWFTSALLVLGAVIGYSLAYGWYTPIGRGDRFMLSLYAPLVMSLVWASESLLRRVRRRHGSRWIVRGYHLAQWALVVVISLRLGEIVAWPYFKN